MKLNNYHKTDRLQPDAYDGYCAKIRTMGFYLSSEEFTGDLVYKALSIDKGSVDKILRRMVDEGFLTRYRPQKNMAYRYRSAPRTLASTPFRKTPADLTYQPKYF